MPSCSTMAASRRRCAPACRCRARSRRSRSTASCWSTAASPTTCRSTRRASSCADVVIAVNISTPPLKRSEITSALSVAGQLVNFLGKQTVDEQLKSLTSRDVLIAPDLGDISAAKFDRSADAIRIGEEATRKLAPALQRYSLPPDQYAALRKTQIAEAKPLGTVALGGVQGTRAHESGSAARAGRDETRRAARRREDRARSAPHLRARRLRGDRLHDRRNRPVRARSSSSRAKNRGAPITSASASVSKATSRATTSSTSCSNTARPGSTGWAANG